MNQQKEELQAEFSRLFEDYKEEMRKSFDSLQARVESRSSLERSTASATPVATVRPAPFVAQPRGKESQGSHGQERRPVTSRLGTLSPLDPRRLGPSRRQYVVQNESRSPVINLDEVSNISDEDTLEINNSETFD